MPLRGESPGPTTSPVTVDLNSVADTFVPVQSSKFIVRRMTIYGATVTLAASSMTIGAYTGAAASGTTLVTPATATGLTAVTKFNDRTIAASADYVTPTSATVNGQVVYGIYVRVAVVHGAAATCQAVFELEELD